MLNRRLLNELTRRLGPENVLQDAVTRRRYAMDALRPYRAFPTLPTEGYVPDVVVTPDSTETVQHVARLAHRFGVPLVPYGGGTGLMGGAAAVKGGIILSMSRINRIININRNDRIAQVETGIVLEKLSRALRARGLVLGHDPWTRPIATLGGAISTNSLGYTAGKYGAIADQVLGLKVVLADGSLLKTRPVGRTSTGVNLVKLFVGTEGCLGIAVEATIRAFPKPESEIIRGVLFPDFDTGFRAINSLYERGYRPTILDFGQPAPSGRGAPLFIGYHGPKSETAVQARESLRIFRKFSGSIMKAKDAETFWRTRHSVAFRYARRAKEIETHPEEPPPKTRFDFLHVWLPASRVREFKAEATKIMHTYGATIVEYGLWGPELFSMAMTCEGSNADKRLFAAVDEALTLAQKLGGSMEYCHGVGFRLQHLMEHEHGEVGLALMRTIKFALDAKGILNPGKLALS